MALEINEDVLRALVNLNASGDPNWETVKNWVRDEFNKHLRLAAFSITQSNEFCRVLQGMAFIINDLSYFFDFPKEHLEKMKESKKRVLTGVEGVG